MLTSTSFAVALWANSSYEEVIKSEIGRNMTFDQVGAALIQLSSPPPFLTGVDESYSIGNRLSFFFQVWYCSNIKSSKMAPSLLMTY